MLSEQILNLASECLTEARKRNTLIATAESCTGGLVSGALTAIPGSSDIIDRGFVTYTNAAKQQMLGVTSASLEKFGAVSESVAKEMAYGAVSNSMADIAVSITGIAGPGGGSDTKPVGLVWFGICQLGQPPEAFSKTFDDTGRDNVRQKAVRCALNALVKNITRGG